MSESAGNSRRDLFSQQILDFVQTLPIEETDWRYKEVDIERVVLDFGVALCAFFPDMKGQIAEAYRIAAIAINSEALNDIQSQFEL